MSTPVSSVVLTQDIRSNSKDYKRAADRQHKWEHGEIMSKGRSVPRKPEPKPLNRKNAKGQSAKGLVRPAIVADRQEALTDSSSDEVEEQTTPAVAPDADVHYSFDAKRGPSHGSQVLSAALEAAVDRFESKETDKLVRDEYEVLDSEGEAMMTNAGKKGKFATAEEEEYEFV
ncbi:hypothetical protein BT63DRAFT_460883 [Microthyrium microscopicum]|uniref:Uncharacterized protein n=1 Tax=Microthyrium microscopicum TaxID=703497 RepID=A0A6A6TVJ9_9PEZI|nr:hypothetical protein BT63DRAFT_460883 [Microthyrium microscopicum]